ncbi:hypothetical protein Maes01_00775 [Microbulbifer aestuariivivens]|uniref:SpaA-like prealbumin fold domain-containing protein n=1 Tax=Microbulbifer aestuariivivens TaxID=1908308 RepID=A0ABP9WLZ2_9GAMM
MMLAKTKLARTSLARIKLAVMTQRSIDVCRWAGLTLLALLALPSLAQTAPTGTPAWKDQTCLAQRISSPNCTAKEFTVSPSFSAEPGTPPFCEAGAEFEFVVDVRLYDSNADRYNIGLFVGQEGNDPQATVSGNSCSVATFPTAPAPWFSADNNACGDFYNGGDDTIRVTEIKVVCQGDGSTGALQVPYVLTYEQKSGGQCSSPADVVPGGKSKCQGDNALVDGVVPVSAGAHIDITKETQPGGEGQLFTYTASGPAGSKVIVRNADGSFTSDLNSATGQATFTLSDGQTARAYITALPSAQTLTVVEEKAPGWDAPALISCSAQRGAPPTTIDSANRTVSAQLDESNSAAACTFINRKLPTLTVNKVSNGDTGSFSFTAGNGWGGETLTTTTPGSAVSSPTRPLANFAVPTELVEQIQPGWRLADISCSGLGSGGSAAVDLASGKVTLDAAAVNEPGADIDCTFTNVRQRTLTVTKNLIPLYPPYPDSGFFRSLRWRESSDQSLSTQQEREALYDHWDENRPECPDGSNNCLFFGPYVRALEPWPAGDNALFIMSANGTDSAAGGDGTSVSTLVDVGSNPSIAEKAGTGTALENYDASYRCDTSPETTGTGSSASLTMPNADVACVFTNTRRSATLTLSKTWVNAPNGVTATVTSNGFINDTTTGAVEANGNNTVTGAPVRVYAGESATFTETYSVGDPAKYKLTLDCSGTSGVSGNSLTIGGSDTAISCTATNSLKLPELSVVKQAQVEWDPINNSNNPKAIPQSYSRYTIRLSNAGEGEVDADSLVVTDALPAAVELYVGDLNGAGQGPVAFTDGSPSSALSWQFIALDSDSDGLEFSRDGTDWSYVPTPGADGFDASVRHIRMRPSGSMAPASGDNASWAEFAFRVRIQ